MNPKNKTSAVKPEWLRANSARKMANESRSKLISGTVSKHIEFVLERVQEKAAHGQFKLSISDIDGFDLNSVEVDYQGNERFTVPSHEVRLLIDELRLLGYSVSLDGVPDRRVLNLLW